MTIPHVVVIVHHIVIRTSALIDVDHRQFSPAGKENENAATLMEVMVREWSWEIWQYTSDCRDKRAGMKGNVQLACDPSTHWMPHVPLWRISIFGPRSCRRRKPFISGITVDYLICEDFPREQTWSHEVTKKRSSCDGDLEIWPPILLQSCRFSIHFCDCERDAPMASIWNHWSFYFFILSTS